MEQHWHHKLCRSLLERNLNYKRLIIIMMLLCFVCRMDVTSIVHVIYGRPVTPVNEVCAILSESNHRSGTLLQSYHYRQSASKYYLMLLE